MGDSRVERIEKRNEKIIHARRLIVLQALEDHDREATLRELKAHLKHVERYPEMSVATIYITLSSMGSVVSFEPPSEEWNPANVIEHPSATTVVVKGESEFESLLFHGR